MAAVINKLIGQATREGDERRAQRKRPIHALPCCPPGYITRKNAIRAKVKLNLAAQHQLHLACPSGAKQGLFDLRSTLNKGMSASEWVSMAVDSVVVHSAPSSVKSAGIVVKCVLA